MSEFRTQLGENVFRAKYSLYPGDTWASLARRVVMAVCRPGALSRDEHEQLVQYITDFKFIPGGRYLYYAGRQAAFYNNCYLLRAEEDTREEWANIMHRSTSCLMSGGGIGIDYSRLRGSGSPLSKTGGTASGPIPLMYAVNELGRNVMQGGSRRSAIYASLDWNHSDISAFLHAKDWHEQHLFVDGPTYRAVKDNNFNGHAPLDMTNISVNYNDNFLRRMDTFGGSDARELFLANVRQALATGEPGFSFNFNGKENETLRNACTEVVSEDDSDVCNLGSVNLAACENAQEVEDVAYLASKFLVCGLTTAKLPYKKIEEVRAKNSRIGLGIMGLHEMLLKRGERYNSEVPILHDYLSAWVRGNERGANEHTDLLSLPRPAGYRAVAPTGTIGIMAGTTTGIEPLYAVAYKRRYLTNGTTWKAEFVVDAVAEDLIQRYSLDPDFIETATDLATDWRRRIDLQVAVQRYTDMAISSTINLPATHKQSFSEEAFADYLLERAPGLRGFTCYPDGSRGGQPLESVPYLEAKKMEGMVIEEHDVCSITGHGGVCGV